MTKYAVVAIAALLLVPSVATAQDGRWKAGGNGECYWDQYDDGPNQCQPAEQEVAQEVEQKLSPLANVVGDECTDDQGATGRWIVVDDHWSCGPALDGLTSALSLAATYVTGGATVFDAFAAYCALSDLWYSSAQALDQLNNSIQMGQDDYITKFRIIYFIHIMSGSLLRAITS